MSTLKDKLIKIGETHPKLRGHLQKIIEAVEKTSSPNITFGGETRLTKVDREKSFRNVLEKLMGPLLKQGGEDLVSVYIYDDVNDYYMAGADWQISIERGFVDHVDRYRYLPDLSKSDLHRAGREFYENPMDAIFTSLLGNNLKKAKVIAGAKPFAPGGGGSFGHAYYFTMKYDDGFSEIEGLTLPDDLIPKLKQEFSARPDGKTKSI